MENKSSLKNSANLLSILSISISLVFFLLILNWLFKITPYQKFQGMPLLIAPFTSLFGFISSYISLKKMPNKIAKWSIAINVMLFVSPFLYWIIGTLVFGV